MSPEFPRDLKKFTEQTAGPSKAGPMAVDGLVVCILELNPVVGDKTVQKSVPSDLVLGLETIAKHNGVDWGVKPGGIMLMPAE